MDGATKSLEVILASLPSAGAPGRPGRKLNSGVLGVVRKDFAAVATAWQFRDLGATAEAVYSAAGKDPGEWSRRELISNVSAALATVLWEYIEVAYPAARTEAAKAGRPLPPAPARRQRRAATQEVKEVVRSASVSAASVPAARVPPAAARSTVGGLRSVGPRAGGRAPRIRADEIPDQLRAEFDRLTSIIQAAPEDTAERRAAEFDMAALETEIRNATPMLPNRKDSSND